MAINLHQIIENSNDNEEILRIEETFSQIEQILKNTSNASLSGNFWQDFHDICVCIREENDLQKKCTILQALEQNLENYKEFANQETIDSIEQIQNLAKIETKWLESKLCFYSASLEIENNERELIAIHNGCLYFFDIVEYPYNYLTNNKHEIIREIANNLIDYDRERPGGELTSKAIAITAELILKEIQFQEYLL